MKNKTLLVLASMLLTNLAIFSQNIVFKDPNFKKALLKNEYQVNKDKNNEISNSEALNTTSLSIDCTEIISLEDLVHFPNLNNIFLQHANKLEKIDLTKQIKLKSFTCGDGFNPNKIDFSKNINLESISFIWGGKFNFTTLDLSKNKKLKRLTMIKHNKIKTINLSENTLLEDIYLYYCKEFTGLNVKNKKNLKSLSIQGCYGINKIDISNNLKLEKLDVGNTRINHNFDLSKHKHLTYIDFINLNVGHIDVTHLPNLKHLIPGNKQGTLDVTKNPKLEYLMASYLGIKNLDISNNLNLRVLWISDMDNLDLTKHTKLEALSCYGTGSSFSSLDLSKCNLNSLVIVGCEKLTTLNLTNQKLKGSFHINNNPNLKIVCTNLDKVDYIHEKLKEGNNNGNYKVSTSCSEETLHEVILNAYYSPNEASCYDNNNRPFNENLQFSVFKDFNFTPIKTIIVNNSGQANTLLQKGKYKFIPNLLLNYFKITPKTGITSPEDVTFTDIIEKPFEKKYCIFPNDVFNDLKISVVPSRVRPGFNTTYKLIYKNVGTTTQSGTVSLNISNPNKQTYISATKQPSIKTSDKLAWSFKNLAPLEERIIDVTFEINKPTGNNAVNAGEQLCYKANVESGVKDETIANNTAEFCLTVVNSWDPNDKTCLEGSTLKPEEVGKYLTYLIRFENKGSAEATHVRVEDIIDTTKFNIKTLEPITGSHDYYTEIENNKVNFWFKNINLGYTDKDNKGYIMFKIKTLDTLKEGDVIKNKASIYFDFNPPIITEYETVTVKKDEVKTYKFSDFYTLTPNPTKRYVTLKEKKTGVKIKLIGIHDINGNFVGMSPPTSNTIDLGYLYDNTYIITLYTENHGELTAKVVKKQN